MQLSEVPEDGVFRFVGARGVFAHLGNGYYTDCPPTADPWRASLTSEVEIFTVCPMICAEALFAGDRLKPTRREIVFLN